MLVCAASWLVCGRVSRPTVRLFAVGSVTLQPMLVHPAVVHVAVPAGAGCCCGCHVGRGGPCVATGIHYASAGPCQENTDLPAHALRPSLHADYSLSLHTVALGAVAPVVLWYVQYRRSQRPYGQHSPALPKGVLGRLLCLVVRAPRHASPVPPLESRELCLPILCRAPLCPCSCAVQLWLGRAYACRCLRACVGGDMFSSGPWKPGIGLISAMTFSID